MASNEPWSENDAAVTVDGSTVGRVKETVKTDDGTLLVIIGDLNPSLIDFFPKNQDNDKPSIIPFNIRCKAENVEDYNNGVIRLPSDTKEIVQEIYDERVQDEIEQRLELMEKSLEEGIKSDNNLSIEMVNEIQEKMLRFREVIRQGMSNNRFDGKGSEYLNQFDKIDSTFQDAIFNSLKNYDDSVESTETDEPVQESEEPSETKNEEVEEEIDRFFDHLEGEILPKVKQADPETKVKLLRDALQGVKEVKAMVRGFDQSNCLENPGQYYEELDELESALREDERNAIKATQNSGSDLESIFKSISEGMKAYSEAKQATSDSSNSHRNNKVQSSRNSGRSNQNKNSEQQPPEQHNQDPYTGGKSNSSSISESVSRVWNTVTLKNAFSPKCPRCNRKSSAPVSGEEDVYQCDNCGNIFDTHPDSRREIDFNGDS